MDRLAGPGVPQTRGFVVGRRKDVPTVRAECGIAHPCRMPRQSNLLAGLNVPDAGGVVIGRRHNAPTIRTKSSASHDPVMFENGGLLTRFRVPQARGFVRRGRNHLPAIGAEGRNTHPFCVPPKSGQLIAILGIPHAGRLVLGSGHNTPAIRREARAPQQAFVAL